MAPRQGGGVARSQRAGVLEVRAGDEAQRESLVVGVQQAVQRDAGTDALAACYRAAGVVGTGRPLQPRQLLHLQRHIHRAGRAARARTSPAPGGRARRVPASRVRGRGRRPPVLHRRAARCGSPGRRGRRRPRCAIGRGGLGDLDAQLARGSRPGPARRPPRRPGPIAPSGGSLPSPGPARGFGGVSGRPSWKLNWPRTRAVASQGRRGASMRTPSLRRRRTPAGTTAMPRVSGAVAVRGRLGPGRGHQQAGTSAARGKRGCQGRVMAGFISAGGSSSDAAVSSRSGGQRRRKRR